MDLTPKKKKEKKKKGKERKGKTNAGAAWAAKTSFVLEEDLNRREGAKRSALAVCGRRCLRPLYASDASLSEYRRSIDSME